MQRRSFDETPTADRSLVEVTELSLINSGLLLGGNLFLGIYCVVRAAMLSGGIDPGGNLIFLVITAFTAAIFGLSLQRLIIATISYIRLTKE